MVLALVGAHGMGWLGGFSLWQPGWIAWRHALFILSAVIRLVVRVPTQVQQGQLAATVQPLMNMALIVLRPQ